MLNICFCIGKLYLLFSKSEPILLYSRDEEVQCLGEQEVIDLTSDEDEVAVVDAAMKTGRIVGNS